jgi:hypothetical protein
VEGRVWESVIHQDEVVRAGFGTGGSLAQVDMVKRKGVLDCSLPYTVLEVQPNFELCERTIDLLWGNIVLPGGNRSDHAAVC